jgi:hypothetical protein
MLPPPQQRSRSTGPNRYPEIFRIAKSFFRGVSISILSFGCSTGEEVETLNDYFSNCIIDGCEINEETKKLATERVKGFTHKNKIAIVDEPMRKYNCIFAMSVLCRHEDERDYARLFQIYPFSMFEGAVEYLHEHLEIGGLMIIYNSNYRFSDTKISTGYKNVGLQSSGRPNVLKHYANGTRLLRPYPHAIFERIS